MIVGAYGTYALSQYGIDPLAAGVLLTPVFFAGGLAVYRFYHAAFERRGTDAGLRGLAFFFGVAFIVEVVLILIFGVDQRMVEAPYIGRSLALGEVRIPMRMLVAVGSRSAADRGAVAVSVADVHGARDQGGGAGRGRAGADGRRSGARQAMGVRHRHRAPARSPVRC